MATPPPCTALGRHCHELRLTLRIADLEEDTPTFQDAAGTWLLGHTERIRFGKPYVRRRELLVDAAVEVPCRFLAEGVDGGAGRCMAHGFRGTLPRPRAPRENTAAFRAGSDRFAVVHERRVTTLTLPRKRDGRRALPVLAGPNPCAGAPCRTADNKRGAACCRDLTLDVMLPDIDSRTEALLRSRRSPYLCKIKRTDPTTIECEVISACGYLDDDRISCMLHDRRRPNGRPAKPSICSEWPDLEDDDEFTGHPGCRLL